MHVEKEFGSTLDLGRNLTIGLLDHLGKAIVVGHYDNKVFPTEAVLADQYGVSRSVTREAVKMLTAKGLLIARPRQGTVIQPTLQWNLLDKDVLRWLLERKFSLRLLRQFTELRVSVEPKGAELAAQYAAYEDLQRMKAAFERMVRADGGDGDPTQADIDFHVSILFASGNPFYYQFQELIRTALMTSIQFTTRVNQSMPNIEAHENIMKAIFDRDPKRAYAAMHLIVNDVLLTIHAQEEADKRAL
ncbi:FadR/GntR family transcriptional regulator [Asticcacaulis sp. AC460]|uniref:FadR/GntR family transcriptional regulator n=1 Tax=Asticcacaulis sp. AC460 TaxID=1282360 RepID=UPI0003FEBB13|nr:FadR/GntR family transcriptional regulator [Asticcacaulis sp. AC460]